MATSFSTPRRGARFGSFGTPRRGARFGSFGTPRRGARFGSFSTPRRGARLGDSVGAGTAHDRGTGPEQDDEVERERPVLHVAKVQTNRLIPREVRASADLPEAGHTRLDGETATHVERVLGHFGQQGRP